MKCGLWLIIISTFVPAYLFSQQAGGKPEDLMYDQGFFVNGVYQNHCLGFSLSLPADWQPLNPSLVERKAMHLPNGGFILLTLKDSPHVTDLDQISVDAVDASNSQSTTQVFVTDSVSKQVGLSPSRSQLIRDAIPVQYGGKLFFRADYKRLLANDDSLFGSYLFTKFRNYFIGVTITTRSPEKLDKATDSLVRISFQQDRINPNCGVGPDNPPKLPVGGVTTGIIGSVPVFETGAASAPKN